MAPNSPRHAPLVLIVEDGDAEYDSVSEYLAERGFEAVGAADVLEALDLAVSLRPDLLLLDLSEPSMGGVDAIRLLRFHDATCSVPVLALTVPVDEGGVGETEARHAGCDGLLRRPFAMERLLDEIHRVLEARAIEPSP